MTFSVGGVTLQFDPSRVSFRSPARVDEFETDDDFPILIVPGKGPIELIIEGTFVGVKSTIETSYLSPLLGKVGDVVAVSGPDSRYDGNFLMVDFTYVELNAKQFRYTIKLLYTGSYIIDGEEWEA